MSSPVYQLAAGAKTPWVDCRPVAGFDIEMHVINPAAVAWTVEIANDPTPLNKLDAKVQISRADAPSLVLSARLPNFIRVSNNGASAITVSFSNGQSSDGSSVPIGPESVESRTTGQF